VKLNATRLPVLCLCALLGCVSLCSRARADARRAGLAGSLLIEDREDVYFFPQRLVAYPNLVALSYGADGGSGSGLLTLGAGDSVFAVALHRGDVQAPHGYSDANALSGPSSLFAPDLTLAPATIVDLLFGTDLGGGELGFRLAFGSGASTTTAADMDTGVSDTFIMGELGYGWGTRHETARVDLSAGLALDMASQEAAGTDVASGTYFGLSGLMRAYFPVDQTLELGVLANVGMNNNAFADETIPGDPARTELGIDLGAGLGPVLQFDRVSIAAYGILSGHIASEDPYSEVDGDESSALTVLIPGVHLALEVPLSDWLLVRSGAQYSFNLQSTSDPADAGTSQRSGSFGWNAGLGVVIDDFRFDGSLQHGFVTGGPDFIGGTGQGFLAVASLSYSFDRLRNPAPINVVSKPPPVHAAPPPAPPPTMFPQTEPTEPTEP
jgi:hypothetical protein